MKNINIFLKNEWVRIIIYNFYLIPCLVISLFEIFFLHKNWENLQIFKLITYLFEGNYNSKRGY